MLQPGKSTDPNTTGGAAALLWMVSAFEVRQTFGHTNTTGCCLNEASSLLFGAVYVQPSQQLSLFDS